MNEKLLVFIKKNHSFILLLLGGFICRLILLSLPGFKVDVDAWFAWAIRMYELGPSHFYSMEIWTNYTPGYLYVLWFLGWLRELFSLDTSLFYSVILKLPSILAELILALFIYKEVLKASDKKWAILSSILILFNPAFIFNSAIWGQIDGLLALFMVLTIYFLTKERSILSSTFFALSFLIKPQTIALLPVFFFYLIYKPSLKRLLEISLPAAFVILLLSLPFFPNQPITGIINLTRNMVSDYSYTSMFAYNIWGVVGFWLPDTTTWLGLSYQLWGYLILVLFWGIILLFFWKKRISFYSLAALSTLSFYFFPTRVHDRYIYPALIFLIIVASITKSKKIYYLTIFLSYLSLMDLYYVYVYYNEIYNNMTRILYSQPIYSFINDHGKLLSLLSTVTFITAVLIIIQYGRKFSKKASA
jgi:dolichyl-phosphate-mannose-protein mannosyltransferase